MNLFDTTPEIIEPKAPNTFFGHMHGGEEGTVEHLTPPFILKALDTANTFDLDPCASIIRPWPMARHHFTIEDDGLKQEWFGRVWMNPPYGDPEKKCGRKCKKKVCAARGRHADRDVPGMEDWMERLARHGDGIALTFLRGETDSFFPWVWEYADAMFVIRRRLTFYKTDGTPHANQKTGKPSNAGCGSVLIAYGRRNAEALASCGLAGKLMWLK